MSLNMEKDNQRTEKHEEKQGEKQEASQKSLKKEESKNSNTFTFNSKYYTISIYTIITVLACSLIIRSIFMWEATRASITGVIRWCYPYLLGFFIAAMLYPMTVFFEKNLFDRLPDPLREKKRGLSIAVSYLLFIGIIVMLKCEITRFVLRYLRADHNHSIDYVDCFVRATNGCEQFGSHGELNPECQFQSD